jgi:hypothetical protein
MKKETIKTSGFIVLEMGHDKFKGYRPCWSGWEETFSTRSEARKAMARHVNELNGSKRGQIGYVRTTDKSGWHDSTTYVVLKASEVLGVIESLYLKSNRSYPWWFVFEDDQD